MTLTWKMKVRLFWPMIGIVSGVMAGLSFAIIYHVNFFIPFETLHF